MAFQLSPGVVTTEIDLTTVVPAVSSTTGAYAGVFQWGPVDFPVLVNDENQLVSYFGEPDSNTAVPFMTAANFLSYGAGMYVTRAANTSSNNAAFSGGGPQVYIPNSDVYYNTYRSANSANFVCARYPGAIGNSLRVESYISNASSAEDFAAWTYAPYFNGPPLTSQYAVNQGITGANDLFHMVVVDQKGLFTGTAGTVLETFPYVSKATDAKDETGTSIYYRDVVFNTSKYIYVIGRPDPSTTNATWDTPVANRAANFSYAGPGNIQADLLFGRSQAVTTGDIQRAYDKFKNSEEIDVSLIATGDHSSTVQQYVIDNIATYRKDCLAFVSPTLAACQSATPATDVTNYKKTTLNRSTSYAVMDNNWKYQYDKYNDVYRWIPLNGDIAGLCARTDLTRDPWFSPAGLSRGQIKNVVKLAYNANKTDRDTLYKAGVNPVVSLPGEGVVLYGDKTMLSTPSAFDRINVRRLFIVLEKAISVAARQSLFEFNDEFTRAQFVSLVEPFLRDVKGRRGIYDYRVVCDTTNNTSSVIDRNEFVGDIYVKPARSINFIQLNFVAVRTGVSFQEVVGKF
jgi:phage tail sheath protein FI